MRASARKEGTPELSFGFDHIEFLLLIAVALVVPYVASRRRLGALRVPTTTHGGPLGSFWGKSPILLQTAALVFVAIAAAGPKSELRSVEKKAEGIDAVIAIDASKSMDTKDVAPTRMHAAKSFAADIVRTRPDDRFAFVSFAGQAVTVSPLTADRQFLLQAIESETTDSAGTGTAIGSALALSVALLDGSESKSKIVLLISDGEDNTGSIPPELATRMAFTAGVRVYTIGVGSEGGAYLQAVDPAARQAKVFAGFNPKELSEISAATGGKYFFAGSAEAFSAIGAEINKLEKSEVLSSISLVRRTYAEWFVWAGLIFFAGSVITEKLFWI